MKLRMSGLIFGLMLAVAPAACGGDDSTDETTADAGGGTPDAGGGGTPDAGGGTPDAGTPDGDASAAAPQ
jgi:hypothetical protein